MRLERMTAVITGGASGMGESICYALAKEGASIVVVDRNFNGAELVTSNVKDLGSSAICVKADVQSVQELNEMANTAMDRFGSIDVLVNNAGVADFGTIETTNFKRWNEVMKTNLDGAFMCSQKAISHLKKTKGSIINIASISGLRASTLRIAYGTSKAAIMQLTKQQAVELGEYGIRVNCVAPGPVKTKLAMEVHTQDIIDAYHDAIPLNRYGTENEIANAIYFLASEEASYITGQVLSVDGGFDAAGVGLPSLRR